MRNNFTDIINRKTNYQQCFKTPAGEKVLQDLMLFCKYRDSSFVVGDPNQTAFNEGMRRVILRIIKFMEMTDDDINKIIKSTEIN